MYDLILVINSLSKMLAICAIFIIIARLLAKRIGIKSMDRLLAKIMKSVIYVLLAALFIHILFSLRIAMK